MLAETHTDGDLFVREFTARVDAAGSGVAARDAYRVAFDRLRSQVNLYPVTAKRPSLVFASAARAARELAASSLPLGIAVVMHLYPLCALQCVPLPLLSPARLQRAALLRTIRRRALILANTGSERSRGACQPLVATRVAGGIRVAGSYEYMSLASVADIALFKATLGDSGSTVFCAANLRSDSVRIGNWKFRGNMRLSDTTSVTFVDHLVPRGRYAVMPGDAAQAGFADYQRCWFHLFVTEIHLARLERLHRVWGLARGAEQLVSLNELSRLREYALRLLDDLSVGSDIETLVRTTAAMKLRASLLGQSTIAALRALTTSMESDARQLSADANELLYIRSQPTADEKILRSLGVEQDDARLRT